MMSGTYDRTRGTVAELWDVVDATHVGLDHVQQQKLVSEVAGRVLVDQFQLDLFAAKLKAEVEAGNVPAHIYDSYVDLFGGNASTLVG